MAFTMNRFTGTEHVIMDFGGYLIVKCPTDTW